MTATLASMPMPTYVPVDIIGLKIIQRIRNFATCKENNHGVAEPTKVSGEPGDIVLAATITAELVGGRVAYVGDEGLLELHQALVLPRLPVVLEGAVEGLLLRVEQDGHPFVPLRVRLRLEVVGPEKCLSM